MCRDIALVLEACVLTLLEMGVEEEVGLFHICNSLLDSSLCTKGLCRKKTDVSSMSFNRLGSHACFFNFQKI